jgi:hypothetical protein
MLIDGKFNFLIVVRCLATPGDRTLKHPVDWPWRSVLMAGTLGFDQVGLGDRELIFAAIFGLIHCFIRRLDQAIHLLSVLGIEANTDASGDVNPMTGDREFFGQGGENFLGNALGNQRAGDIRQHDNEFVAAEAGDGVAARP